MSEAITVTEYEQTLQYSASLKRDLCDADCCLYVPKHVFDPFKSTPLQVLSRLEKLEELRCGGCLLGDAGADHLATGIADNRGLKVTILTINMVDF